MRPEEALLGAAAEVLGPCRLGADLSWDHGESLVREIVAADGTVQIGKAHRRATNLGRSSKDPAHPGILPDERSL